MDTTNIKSALHTILKGLFKAVFRWNVLVDLMLFVGVVLVIFLPQTHVYFEVTHWNKIQQVVDHMQTTYQNNGENGLNTQIKDILSH